MLNRYLERLRENREALNRLNVYPVPDGDTGTNMITIVTGIEADEAVTDSITFRLGKHHADLLVDVVDGGQPLYPYLFGVE